MFSRNITQLFEHSRVLLVQMLILVIISLTINTEAHKRFGGTYHDKHNLIIVNDHMPLLTFGTYQLSGDILEQALDKALEIGYRHIDTATLYNNEENIGNVLKKWFSNGKLKREDVYITTKFPRYATNDPKLIPKYLQQSLEKLQLDYVDMYLIHVPFYTALTNATNPDGTYKIVNTDIIGLWKEMEVQYESGKAKAIGLGNFNQSQIIRIKNQTRILPALLQTELHPYLQEKALVDYCKNVHIPLSAFTPLGTESLTENSNVDGTPLKDEVVMKMAKKYGKTSAQMILRFLYQQNIAMVTMNTDEKLLKEHFEISAFSLNASDIRALKQLDKGEKGRIGRFSDLFKGIEKSLEYPEPY